MSLPSRIFIWLVIFLGIAFLANRQSKEVAKFKRKKDFWPMTDLLLYVGLRIATWGSVFVALVGVYGIYTQG